MTTAFTNNFDILLNNIRTLLQSEFSDYVIYVGDRPQIKQPTIILEPADKVIDSGIAMGKKNQLYSVSIWIYRIVSETEQGVVLLTNATEQIEQCFINNVKYISCTIFLPHGI